MFKELTSDELRKLHAYIEREIVCLTGPLYMGPYGERLEAARKFNGYMHELVALRNDIHKAALARLQGKAA